MMHMSVRRERIPSTITLRNVPKEVGRRLVRRAREKNLSLNKAVLEALSEALLPPKKPEMPPGPPFHDLDFIIGTWTKEEADEFDRRVAEARQIDEELWR